MQPRERDERDAPHVDGAVAQRGDGNSGAPPAQRFKKRPGKGRGGKRGSANAAADGDYDEDDIRLGMADFGITEGTPGDMDGDDDVDAADFALLRNQIGVETLGCVGSDINGDGTVNGADLAYILSFWGATCP